MTADNKRALTSLGVSLVLSFAYAANAVYADEGRGHGSGPSNAQTEIVQTTCPVLTGSKINPAIYTEYKGKKVYFCCSTCKATFERSPEKYVSRLPQFSDPGHSEEKEGRHFNLGSLVRPFGIATLTLLALTACAGLFRRKNPKLLLKWHKRLAFATVALALCHALLVLLFH
ncbi:MAG: YHS domain-containing protein [Planctomycetes bacterium]|nr:YHS domain-containing protein [Planctomycetota bacterium]